MAKTRYRKRTRRVRTKRYKRKGGTGTPPRPTQAQINNTYKKRNWNSRPAALNINKSPTSSEKRRKEEKREEEEIKEEEKSEMGLFQSIKAWRDSRKEQSDKFKNKFKK